MKDEEIKVDVQLQNFLSPEFGAAFRREVVPVFLEVAEFSLNTM